MSSLKRNIGAYAAFALAIALLAVTTLAVQAAEQSGAMGLRELRCESQSKPIGVDTAKPRLSWKLDDPRRGARQTAYRVLVASSLDKLAQDQSDLWDSGQVVSHQSHLVEYGGKPLTSRQIVHWKVRVWDKDGKESHWSEPALWSMGLLKREEWQARWIGYDAAYDRTPERAKDDELFNIRGLKWVQMPSAKTNEKSPARMADGEAGVNTHLRKQITVPSDRRLKRAVLALYAFNECVATVNGAVIGRAAHWEPTARLDATQSLKPGANVIAVTLSHTDSYLPAAIGRLVLQFESGNDEVLPLDQTWKASEQPAAGWDKAGFDDGAWVAAQVLDKHPWKGVPTPVADLARLPAPYLRKEFTVAQAVKRATVYVTALGVYELRLNGKRVSADVLAPGWTEFNKRVHYQTYDVTAQVAEGANTLGAILGDGWYASTLAHLAKRNIYGGRPRFLAQLELELADGSTQVVSSDESWKASYGPIRHADLLMGCEYDARLVMPGWDQAGFDDSSWKPVVGAPVDATRRIQASVAEPARIIEELPALALTEPKPKTWTFDLGQNMVGWVRLKVRGAAGQRITVRHGEAINADGTVYTASLRSCPAVDFYVLAGKGEEVFEPYFTFHGFRYVEIRGLDVKPGLDAVTGLVAHTPMQRTGSFECSHAMLNKLYSNIVWSQKGNYLEIVTDCPQRDERMGWGLDSPLFALTGAYNFDVAAFHTRSLQTWVDGQRDNGVFALAAPDIMHLVGSDHTGWSDTPLILTYLVYRVYGDTRVVAEHFDALERYMQWLDGKTVEGGITKVGSGMGDWLNLGGGVKIGFIDTAYHAYLARIMSEMAAAIGRSAEAAAYTKRHEKVKAALVKHFLQDDGTLNECSQTGYAMAFSMDLVPAEMREKVAETFVDEINRFNWHLATGGMGTPRLLPALSLIGRDDVAYRLLLNDTYPSWLFHVKHGATTTWERWDSWTPDKGFQSIDMNSFNHNWHSSVGEYLYGGIGGIQAASPGYKKICIRPVIRDGITWAKTSYDSIHGKIATDWKVEAGKLEIEVLIPANTTATVHVPVKDSALVTESGKPANAAEGVRFLRMENDAALYEVGSGTYRFGASLPQ